MRRPHLSSRRSEPQPTPGGSATARSSCCRSKTCCASEPVSAEAVQSSDRRTREGSRVNDQRQDRRRWGVGILLLALVATGIGVPATRARAADAPELPSYFSGANADPEKPSWPDPTG